MEFKILGPLEAAKATASWRARERSSGFCSVSCYHSLKGAPGEWRLYAVAG
jgi:hypothetical protein